MERICYMNPVLGAPYGYSSYPNTAAGAAMYYAPRTNPMEEAYRYALRNLEDSFEREMEMLHVWGFSGYDDAFYRREHDIKSRYYSQRERLEYDLTRDAQQYYYSLVNQGYGYGLRRQRWEWPVPNYDTQLVPYQYTYSYINSKETTPVATEAKKYIIISSEGPNDNPKTHTTLADAEKEAQRLARKFPAQEFTIYETKKAYKIAEKPVDVKHFI